MILSDIPSRAEFIRDRLAEHLDGLGYIVYAEDFETEFETCSLAYEGPDFADGAVAVHTDGTILPLVGFTSPSPLVFPGFAWTPEPTDTGVTHGPAPAFPRLVERVRMGDFAHCAPEGWRGVGSEAGGEPDTGVVHGPFAAREA